MSEPGQPDGFYPRLNGEMMKSGKFVGNIVSIVGHFDNDSTFRCCDGNVVQISTDMVADMPETRDPKVAVELVGQISSPDLLAIFVVRELSLDMDVSVYNRMLAVRIKPEYAEYFAPVQNM